MPNVSPVMEVSSAKRGIGWKSRMAAETSDVKPGPREGSELRECNTTTCVWKMQRFATNAAGEKAISSWKCSSFDSRTPRTRRRAFSADSVPNPSLVPLPSRLRQENKERKGADLDADLFEQGLCSSPRHLDEPVIVFEGMSCRLPGSIRNPETFWKALIEGRDCIREIPRSRFDLSTFYHPVGEDVRPRGTMYVRECGYIEDAEDGYVSSFPSSVVEMLSTDPQQRILLQVTEDALRSAAPAAQTSGQKTATGVFIGAGSADWTLLRQRNDNFTSFDSTGASPALFANRISHAFDFHGPSMTIDTACASSLTAAFVGVQCLRSGEAKVVIVGAAQLNMEPFGFLTHCASRILSPDSRCKTFDDAADGFVRSEGCVVFVLSCKRKSEIRTSRTHVAVLRGIASDHCGWRRTVMTTNVPAQTRTLRNALKDSKIDSHEIVRFVETHGTGTTIGDTIEVTAIQEVYGSNTSSEDPIMVGATKTNIGHTESVSGVTGLLKALLCLTQQVVPPNLHLRVINRHLRTLPGPKKRALCFPSKATQLCTRERAAEKAEPVFGAISSFGSGGANAHAILEAVCSESLHKLGPEEKNRFNAVFGSEIVVFFFSGHPRYSQLINRSLYNSEAVYRVAVHNCSDALGRGGVFEHAHGMTLAEILYPSDGAQASSSAAALQRCGELWHVATFTVQWALGQLLLARHVYPSAVLGYSLGEYAAAAMCGLMSMEDAIQLVYVRARALVTQCETKGVMM